MMTRFSTVVQVYQQYCKDGYASDILPARHRRSRQKEMWLAKALYLASLLLSASASGHQLPLNIILYLGYLLYIYSQAADPPF
jgi:hypothetical protein